MVYRCYRGVARGIRYRFIQIGGVRVYGYGGRFGNRFAHFDAHFGFGKRNVVDPLIRYKGRTVITELASFFHYPHFSVCTVVIVPLVVLFSDKRKAAQEYDGIPYVKRRIRVVKVFVNSKVGSGLTGAAYMRLVVDLMIVPILFERFAVDKIIIEEVR